MNANPATKPGLFGAPPHVKKRPFFWNQIPHGEFLCGATPASGNCSRNLRSARAANVGLPAIKLRGSLHEHAYARIGSVSSTHCHYQ